MKFFTNIDFRVLPAILFFVRLFVSIRIENCRLPRLKFLWPVVWRNCYGVPESRQHGKRTTLWLAHLSLCIPKWMFLKPSRVLVKKKISGAAVVDMDNNLLGVFSEKCCMQVLIDATYEGLPTNQVGSFMDTDPQTITEDTMLLSIAQVFLLTPRRRLPVVNNRKLVGQISRRDVIRAASRMIPDTACRESTLLYLSALHEMNEAPLV